MHMRSVSASPYILCIFAYSPVYCQPLYSLHICLFSCILMRHRRSVDVRPNSPCIFWIFFVYIMETCLFVMKLIPVICLFW
jgi:hypothetical protein